MKSRWLFVARITSLSSVVSACQPKPSPATPPQPPRAAAGGQTDTLKEEPSKAATALKGGSGYVVAPVANPGALVAKVSFTGDPIPEPLPVQVNIDVPHCGQKVFTENLLIDRETRGLKNVVVRLEGIARGKPQPETVTVMNKDCAFQPHVSVAVKGTKIILKNADPVLHTTHPYLAGSSFFNLSLAAGDEPPPARPIPKAGLMEITCDVHKWMRGYMYVHTNPYVELTDRTGQLKIADIPPGRYPYVAWHESLGEKRGEVEIVAGQSTQLTLEYSPPK